MEDRKGKPENLGETWMKVFRYIKRYKYMFVAAAALSAISSFLSLLGPYFLSDMTDLIQEGLTSEMDYGGVKHLAIILASVYLISGLINFGENYMMATVSQRSAQMFRYDISRKINRIPLHYFDKSSKGDIMSRVTNDVDVLGTSMNQCIGSLVTSITVLSGTFVLMLIMNIPLTLLSLAIAVTGFAVIKTVAKKTQKYFRSQQKNLGAMNGLIEEQYTGHAVVSLYAGQREAMERFTAINEELRHSAFKSSFLGGISFHVSGLISNAGYVLICVTGAALYLDGRISFGVIIAFMIYVKLFTGAFSQISSAIVKMQSVAAAAERVFKFLDYEEMPEEQDADLPLPVKGHVEFRNVCFGYDPGKEIIHDFSADIKPGQMVAIVGPTGAGKTTLINLLMRFYEVDSGDILIDGRSVRSMSREQVRRMFGMVLQDSWVFEGTVRENIVFNRENVSDSKLDEVCQAVGLNHFISALPEGYDTLMKSDESVSAGQRQQIAIARAMISDPPMMILDEATSSVDPLTEKMIQNAARNMIAGRTSFVIAHRLSTIVDADVIMVVKDGAIAEVGKHDELLAGNGPYRELFRSQFEIEPD